MESGKPRHVYTDPKQAHKALLGRIRYHRNKDKMRARQHERYHNGGAKKQLQYYYENKDKISLRVRNRKHGFTPEQYAQLLSIQGGKCAICGKSFTNTPMTDHDHGTGLVRGLLCEQCNLEIEIIEDRAWLDKALKYVSGGDQIQ